MLNHFKLLIAVSLISSVAVPRAHAQDIRKKAYMDITNIEVTDPATNQRAQYASEVSGLKFILHYNGLQKNRVSVHLLYRFLWPDGSLALLSDMDAYSGETDITVQPQTSRTATLATVPSSANKPFVPGNYSFELWYEGRLIHSTSFELRRKPNEASYLTVDKQEYTFEGVGESQTFQVSTDADTWTVNEYPDWCTILDKGTTGFTVKAASNTSFEMRFGTLQVQAGNFSSTIKLYQRSASNELITGDWRKALQKAMANESREFDHGSYKGEWTNGPHGLGIYLDRDGTVYAGEWENGKRSGFGLLMGAENPNEPLPANCSYFSGYWRDNRQDGVCIGFDRAGCPSFSGGFSEGVRDVELDDELDPNEPLRFEAIKQPDEGFYVGETKGGLPDGYGMLLSPNGDIWFGEWSDGERSTGGQSFAGAKEAATQPSTSRSLRQIASDAQKAMSNLADRVRGVYEEEEEVTDPSKIHQAQDVLNAMPSFQGGDTNTFAQWVSANLVYPQICRRDHITGTVKLQFTVDAKGNVKNVHVITSVHPLLDEEAVRVVKSSPKWSPGLNDGKPVPVTFGFPVVFSLTDE